MFLDPECCVSLIPRACRYGNVIQVNSAIIMIEALFLLALNNTFCLLNILYAKHLFQEAQPDCILLIPLLLIIAHILFIPLL
jgi:hypothetical protein